MKTIFVTGCCGFIGYKVSEMLLDKGFSVVGVDDMNDYYDPRLKQWRLEVLNSNPARSNFIFYKIDISDFLSIKRIFEDYTFDAVINLAARAGVRASIEAPWIYLDTNIKGTLNLLECCKSFNIRKFVLASSSSLYGDNNKIPFKTTDKTDNCLAPYAATKKAAEVLSYSYHHLYGIDISIPRYFTVYGPAGRPDMSIFRFIKNVASGKPIVIYGDGRQKRDFTYITDIADGTIRCLGDTGYGIYNFGNDKPVELLQVVGIIEEVIGKKAAISFAPAHPADVRDTWADINLTRERLGWSPIISVKQGIEMTVEWYMANRDFVDSLNTG